MMPRPAPHRRYALRRSPWAAALLAILAFAAGIAGAVGSEPLSAALLTRDLGDPRAPGNVKLVVALPPSLADRIASVAADDFLLYVYPAHLTEEEGTTERHRSRGVYMWRSGGRIFLDSRLVPHQDEEGPATVKVVYAPGGVELARGIAEGVTRYAGDLADVILAVDISRSMLYNDRDKLRVTAARTFIEMARMGGGVGCVGLVTFNHDAFLNVPLVPLDRGEELLAALSKVGADGLTNLDGPLRMGMRELLAGEGSRRPVIILLTDGKNEGSRYRDTHEQCAEAGVRLFTVGLSQSADHVLLEEMADATGGIYFRAPRDSDLPEIYARLAAELGKRQLLHAELLRSEAGGIDVPVDDTVARFVAMADAGAKVTASGPDGGAALGGGMGSVFMVNPEAGDWRFSWTEASPGLSALALFGETQFFLDVFPPQLRGGRLAVGATLASGSRPLGDAEVWVEPIAGVTDAAIRLFDDGRHGDGPAGDGVYGAIVDFPEDRDRFDIVLRAAGSAWDRGAFVRQNLALVIRSDDPEPPGSASLDGDVDFGVLFPGETGTALATVDLDAPGPRDLHFDLSWNTDGEPWPDLTSNVNVEPGRRAFELEMMVPLAARPGEYTGVFSITDGAELGDRSVARVRVGTVTFGDPGEIDLGVVPPGTFASRVIDIPYAADKAAPLELELTGDVDLSVTPAVDGLEAGRGGIPLEAMVSVPIGKESGEYGGLLRVKAGPGFLEVPIRWEVRPYSIGPAARAAPPPGLPPPPELPGDKPETPLTPARPSARGMTPAGGEWTAGGPSHETVPGDISGINPDQSPWERAAKTLGLDPDFRDGAGDGGPPLPDGDKVEFPAIAAPEKAGGDSFWSAWWVYLLAALLLLLLLLLLIAYILYRLGKSALARFLLVSALANLILLAIFIALLGTIAAVAPRTPPALAINLVEEAVYDPPVDLTEAEKSLLAPASLDGQADGGGSASAAGEISFAGAASGAGDGEAAREVRLPEDNPSSASLAESTRTEAVPLEREAGGAMSRRQRRAERSNLREAMPELAEMTEMAEPPRDDADQSGQPVGDLAEIGEPRLDIMAPVPSDTPVWSDGRREAQPLASAEGVLLTEATGMEAVSLDETASRVDPRGRRRNPREVPASYPEPRVEIDDPIRDTLEVAASSPVDEADPGVEEIRSEPRSMGTARLGGKPGAIVEPGASRLMTARTEPLPRGISGEDTPEPALARGGTRSARGASGRQGTAVPGPEQVVPGGVRGGSGASGAPASGGASTGAAIGERRFDAGAASGGGDEADGFGASGTERAAAGGGDAASPSPLAGSGSGGGGERADFPSGGGSGGSGNGDDGLATRGSGRRGDRRGGGDMPGGLGGPPGGTGPGGLGTTGAPGEGGRGDSPGGGGSGGSRRGPGSGVGEGRFDGGAGSGGGLATRGAGTAGLDGFGKSKLSGDGAGPGLTVIPLAAGEGEWRRNDRRDRGRTANVAASSLDMDSLLIVVGDLARLPDDASINLFGALRDRLARGLTIEERRLSPGDGNLGDTLLALISPAETRGWTDADVRAAASYLAAGGHIWMDGASPSETDPFMERLTAAAGGRFGPLDPGHQLSDGERVDALFIDGKLAAVSTHQDWRRDWRHGEPKNGRAFRFLTRSLNFFLSGNADAGVTMEPEALTGDRYVEPVPGAMPESLADGRALPGRAWDDFGPATAASWRMPSWSDPGRISAISDGEGGRALRLDADGAVKGRSAVFRTLSPAQDFSGVERVTVDVYYDGEGAAGLSMVFTVPGSGGWADFETPPVTLAPGWSSHSFPLGGANFRRLVGGSGYGTPLPGREKTGRAGFFVYRDRPSAALIMFRDIRLHDE